MISKKFIVILLTVVSVVMLMNGIVDCKLVEKKQHEIVKAEYERILPIIE